MMKQTSFIMHPLATAGKPTLMGKHVRDQLLQLSPKCLTVVAKTYRSNSGITPTPTPSMTERKALDSDTAALSEMPTELSGDSDGFSSWDSSTEISEDGRHSQVCQSPRYENEVPFRRANSGGSLGTLAKLPRNSFDTTPGSKFAQVTEARCPPVSMNVIAPGVAGKCQGTYELIMNREINGQPLWKHCRRIFGSFQHLVVVGQLVARMSRKMGSPGLLAGSGRSATTMGSFRKECPEPGGSGTGLSSSQILTLWLWYRGGSPKPPRNSFRSKPMFSLYWH